MSEESYKSLIESLFEKHPSFQVVGEGAYKPGLEGMYKLDASLGSPSKRTRCIHVAGTNGKGSVCHMIAAALMQIPGIKVGLYTSPHLLDFRERIKVNGEMIPKDYVYDFLLSNNSLFEEQQSSFFEITTAMAFSYFAMVETDIAVIECGLGGRLDSTNIITPMLSIITNIGFDHCSYLGHTLREIATEKGGIIKEGVPVVIGESAGVEKSVLEESSAMAVKSVFEEIAKERSAPLYFAELLGERRTILPKGSSGQSAFSSKSEQTGEDSVCGCRNYDASAILKSVDLSRMDLKGDYQRENLKTVSTALTLIINRLQETLGAEFDDKMLTKITRGIENAAHITGLYGRWQKLSDNPLIICDIGHNPHGIRALMPQVERTAQGRKGKFWFIFGIMKDKDLEAEIPYLPRNAHYLYVNASSERALPAEELERVMSGAGFVGEAVVEVEDEMLCRQPPIGFEALQDDNYKIEKEPSRMQSSISVAISKIRESASPEDFIFIGGSSYVVAEALEELQGRENFIWKDIITPKK